MATFKNLISAKAPVNTTSKLDRTRADKFARIAESLRQFRRAELLDFKEPEQVESPVGSLYVDALEGDAVLRTVLANSTTFLVGRKGTGKSTVFAKAQLDFRKREDVISIYIDVKSLHELVSSNEPAVQIVKDGLISDQVLRAHLLRKGFLAAVMADLIKELKKAYEASSLFDKWLGSARSYTALARDLEQLSSSIQGSGLTSEEIPILQIISRKDKLGTEQKQAQTFKDAFSTKLSAKPEVSLMTSAESHDESIANSELYEEYADAILRSFPFAVLLARIKELLRAAGLNRLFVFFDDFSELAWIDQKLFVDVVLSPLNNASDEMVRLKVAGYPGRIYYGKIDPGKVDTIGLDFYNIYKAQDIQTSEASAISYLERLLSTRFEYFDEVIADFIDSSYAIPEFYRLLFEVTLNVPRLIGYILHYCYMDRVSKLLPINAQSIRLAAQRYYDNQLRPYFDRMNRFALEPFERKLDRHNQQQMLHALISEAKNVRRGITHGQTGGRYFEGLNNPPVSHFTVDPKMEPLLSALELNMLLTKYHEMRDKSGSDVSVYTFFYGLCESERFPWGYPRGRRDDRSYFVQRCFNYNGAIQQFLAKNRTIRCDTCGACFGMEKQDSIQLYKWRCPECQSGTCKVVALGDDFKQEMERLDKATMLPTVELDILEALNEEDTPMRAGQIGALVDATYQLVGHRTAKLHEMGLVHKTKSGTPRSKITSKARQQYFGHVTLESDQDPE